MTELTWEFVVAILGGLITFLTFLYNMIGKKDNKQPEPESNGVEPWRVVMEKDIVLMIEQIKTTRHEITQLKKDLETSDETNREIIRKFEDKLEKLMDILIDHIKKN
jgi:hypothetical protein